MHLVFDGWVFVSKVHLSPNSGQILLFLLESSSPVLQMGMLHFLHI
jgi:hypothetical protein